MTSLYTELARVIETERERDRAALASVRAAAAARQRRGSEPRSARLVRIVRRALGREDRTVAHAVGRAPARSVACGACTDLS
jgi:hypothetical protein